MVGNAEKGRRYRVIDDDCEFFEAGDVVVSLEDDDTPCCVLESNYDSGKELVDYSAGVVSPLADYELEEMEEGEV